MEETKKWRKLRNELKKKQYRFYCSEQMSEGEMTEEDAEESGSSDLLSDGFTGISEWA